MANFDWLTSTGKMEWATWKWATTNSPCETVSAATCNELDRLACSPSWMAKQKFALNFKHAARFKLSKSPALKFIDSQMINEVFNGLKARHYPCERPMIPKSFSKGSIRGARGRFHLRHLISDLICWRSRAFPLGGLRCRFFRTRPTIFSRYRHRNRTCDRSNERLIAEPASKANVQMQMVANIDQRKNLYAINKRKFFDS
jgi:hypothetical protein